MEDTMSINLHQDLVDKNLKLWNRKPLLQKIYTRFHQGMATYLSQLPDGKIVELGSGMGNIHDTIPGCIRTELFPFPWIDQVENAYKLTFADNSVSDLLMMDVFHHLRYPGTALQEFRRVLKPKGRIIMMEPGLGWLGYVVYGLFHPERIGSAKQIIWFAPEGWSPDELDYYTAQGNATYVFAHGRFASLLDGWKIIEVKRIVSLSYAASGGYSGPQLYPTFLYPFMTFLDRTFSLLSIVFGTRLLVVLEKTV
jgi:SAM-dependent methyltransferase